MAAASFTAPPVKKPTTGFQPRRRGKIKAQIFGGIVEAVASAASRARDFVRLVNTIDDDDSAPATPPPRVMVGYGDGEESGKGIVDFIVVEKEP